MMGYRIGIDTGGTFTDVALINEENGEIYATKVPSTPHNPSDAIVQGMERILEKAHITEADITFFIHGTTVATNALLEQKGAKTALMTTKGFKDVLQIGRQTRVKLYDFRARKPAPLVPRHLRVEVTERIRSNGNVLLPMDTKQVKELIVQLKRQGVESIAVCLINSYTNDRHETLIKQLIEQEFPDVYVSLSCEVLPEYREYERTSTVVINAYVMPKMKHYLISLSDKLREKNVASDVYIMQSNGGIIPKETAIDVPARTILSGPAGGALAGMVIAQMTGRSNVITIDMGGTSMDTCLIENQQPHFTTMSEMGGMPIKLPMIEMHTIGSGGGSIAWIDPGGALRVGPQSAGAFPGPVCYGRGGTEPTVTDANVILGRINPEFILGGAMKVDVDAARRVVHDKIAQPLRLSVEQAAEGILRIVNANMVRGIHVVSVEKGHDPRQFSLVAFGGAGPVNAVDIGMELGCSEIIVPEHPGITCAIGMLKADVKHDYVQTYLHRTTDLDYDEFNELLVEMEEKAIKQLNEEGFRDGQRSLTRSVDLRYKGQSYELTVPLADGRIHKQQLDQAVARFHENYEKLYGYCREQAEVELVNIRLTSIGYLSNVDFNPANVRSSRQTPRPVSFRNVYFHGGFCLTPVYERSMLQGGMELIGPAIVEQLDSTVVIYPGQHVICDPYGNLIIDLSAERESEEEGKQNAYQY